MPAGRPIPEASVARLPVYLRALGSLAQRGVATASSEELAQLAGVTAAKLRKDLSYLGSHGTRGVGYDVALLQDRIAGSLGLNREWRVAIVGVGNLGSALAGYAGFSERGFQVVALLDVDSHVVGTRIGELVVDALADLEAVVAEQRVHIGVLAVPAEAAQEVCDRLVAANVRSILNFAPVVLQVAPDVTVRKADLSTELQILAFHADKEKP